MLTEIEQAAVLWDFDAALMKEALTLHNEILRSGLRETRGYEVRACANIYRAATDGLTCFLTRLPIPLPLIC